MKKGDAPFVHEDGRVSWKHPGRDEIYKILAQAAEEFPEAATATTSDGAAQKGGHHIRRGTLKRLRMMIKNGVPLAAVEQRARLEGVDPALILESGAEENEKVSSSSSSSSPSKKMYDPLKKYKRMLKAGLPMAAIKQKATIDGVEFEEADLLVEDNNNNNNSFDESTGSPPLSITTTLNKKNSGQYDNKENSQAKDEIISTNKNKVPLFKPSTENSMVIEFLPHNNLARLVTKVVQTISKRPTVGGSTKHNDMLVVDVNVLYHALGAFCGVRQQVNMYNSTVGDSTDMSDKEACARRKPLLELMSTLGISPPTEWNMEVNIDGLDDLIQFIETKFAAEINAIETNLKVGMYDFDSLAQVYRPGSRVVAKNSFAGGIEMMCEVAWNRYEQGRTLFGVSKTFKVCFQFVAAVGKHFTICEFVESMQSFEGRRSTNHLSFVPLQAYSDVDAANITSRFVKRGQLYDNVATKASFMAYDKGTFYAKRTPWSGGTDQMAALHTSGRMMVDTQASYESGHTISTGKDEYKNSLSFLYSTCSSLL